MNLLYLKDPFLRKSRKDTTVTIESGVNKHIKGFLIKEPSDNSNYSNLLAKNHDCVLCMVSLK